MPHDAIFYYHFDPLCGWCYAAAPAIAALSERYGSQLIMMPSGLFQHPRPVWAIADHAWTNDQRIEKLTGQRFTTAYRDNVLLAPEGVFCSASLTAATLAFGQEDSKLGERFLNRAQVERYVNGRDTSRADVVADIAAGFASELKLAGDFSRERLESDGQLHRAAAMLISESQSRMAKFGLRTVPQLHMVIDGVTRIFDTQDLYGGAELLFSSVERQLLPTE